VKKTLTAKLVIEHGHDGQPLPFLEVKIGESTYRLLSGDPVQNWRPGCVTERIASAAVDLSDG
jgi:hypothetical protein